MPAQPEKGYPFAGGHFRIFFVEGQFPFKGSDRLFILSQFCKGNPVLKRDMRKGRVILHCGQKCLVRVPVPVQVHQRTSFLVQGICILGGDQEQLV